MEALEGAPRRSPRQRLRDGARTVRRNLVELALLDLAFQGLGLVLVGPLLGASAALLISRSGSAVVGNHELASFFLSPTGLALLLGVLCVRATRDYLLLSAFVALLEAERAGVRPTALLALGILARRFGQALSIGIRIALRVGAVAAPILAAAAGLMLLVVGERELQFLVEVKPPRYWVAVVGACLLALTLFVAVVSLLARSALAVPMLVRGGATSKDALALSAQRVGARWRRVALRLTEWWLAVVITSALSSLALGWLGMQAVELVARFVPAATALAMALFLMTGLLLTAVIDLFAWGGQAAYLVQLDEELPGGAPVRLLAPTTAPRSPTALWIGALLLGLLGFGAVAIAAELLEPPRPVTITAHRGSLAAAPENTRAAVLQAIADGADYAEIDVQELADGALVMFHDSDLMRFAGRRDRVRDLDLAGMRALDLGSWFDPRFAGERVMTLEEVIELVGQDLRLNIELKLHGGERALERSLVDTLRRTDFIERCVVTSLDAGVLQRVRALAPELRTGFIVTASVGDRASLGVDLLAVSTRLATRDEIRRARAVGLELHVWTVNTRPEMERFLARGVDGILTDHPALLRALLDERAERSDQERLLRALRRWWKD